MKRRINHADAMRSTPGRGRVTQRRCWNPATGSRAGPHRATATGNSTSVPSGSWRRKSPRAGRQIPSGASGTPYIFTRAGKMLES